MKKFNWPLMNNNINHLDKKTLIKFINSTDKFTNGIKVKNFEKKWSKWLGVKYSTFVNSGASANLISLNILKEIKKNKSEVILPAFTWSSDVVSVINSGFKPIFVDIKLKNLALDEELVKKKITKKTAAIFLTHAMGFLGISKKFLNFINKKKIFLIEDTCESHGVELDGKKAGTLGGISNFSFYYAHHISTIEGGMICTNNKKIYETSRMLRAHGMLRECGNKSYEKSVIKKNKQLSPKFIFLYPGYNMRNNELSAVIGISQLKRLDTNNVKRIKNLNVFLNNINKDFYRTDFDTEGSCNYAFPLILKKKSIKNRTLLENIMKKNNIEFRRGNAGGGNQLRQPYLKKFVKNVKLDNFKEVDHIHFYGYYIGNYPSLSNSKIIKVCKILNSIV